ncbi:carbohydrate ABC transporter permease [Microbacterium kribbense]|uniref:Carbohydrate ABC transporter permease n=1 Tax=Microbacterium kribbense TaxID=433645 RepID=A0ABP7GNS1_9MICO
MTVTAAQTRTRRRGRQTVDGSPLHHTHRRLTSVWATVAALVIAVVWTIPTFGLFVSSFRPPADITTSGWWTAFTNPQFTLENYINTLNFNDTITVGESFINSLTISIPATVFPITIALMAAYAFAWVDFRGKDALFIAVFALQVVPLQMALVPLLSMYSNGLTIFGLQIFPGLQLNGLASSFAQVWMSHTMFALPLAIFILHNSVAAIPSDVIEAAKMDGAGHGQMFFRIVLPLSMPAVAAFAIFQFLWVWNDLLVATIFAPGANAPITKLLTDLSGTFGQQWYLLSAGTFLGIIVPLIVFFTLQRFFVRGLLAGATKG